MQQHVYSQVPDCSSTGETWGMVIKFIMKQHLVCAQWKNNAATGQTVTLKGCQKQVGREGMSGLGLDLSLLTFYCARWRNIFGDKQGAFISSEKRR